MKIPAIKKLVENYSLAQLQEAESSILEEQKPSIEVEGDELHREAKLAEPA